MAALVAASIFRRRSEYVFGLWKMDGPDEPGHDGVFFARCPSAGRNSGIACLVHRDRHGVHLIMKNILANLHLFPQDFATAGL
jgi:hypothetical protein